MQILLSQKNLRTLRRTVIGIERASVPFETTLERAGPLAFSSASKLRIVEDAEGNPPDEVQLEFGIILSAEAGAIRAAASSAAKYKVTMTWRQPSM